MRRWLFLVSLLFSYTLTGRAATVEVKLPRMVVRAGKPFEVSVTVPDVSKLELLGVDLTLKYDPKVLTATGIEAKRTLTEDWTNAHRVTEGEIRISTANAKSAAGKGTLLKILFRANPRATGASSLEFTKLRFNENQISVESNIGRVKIRPREDCNSDDRIDIADLILTARHLGLRLKGGAPEEDYDVNEDGEINIFDVVFVSRRLGESVMADD